MRYDHAKIEKGWQKQWLAEAVFEPDLDRAKNPYYNLMMFPYPSAEGLHVGNMYAFTGSDIYGRYMRMQGFDVFEPMGLDGFGIHSENFAIKTGQHPTELAKKSEKNFYRQLQMLGNAFAWNERLETYDPEYYRWTQWIFLKMFEKGLAYRKKSPVNWCPSCKTVLADEQVIGGACERCDSKVEKRDLEQWFFRITNYAERLLNDLEKIDWSEKVKIAQRNWIGRSEGALLKFPLRGISGQPNDKHFVEAFTTRPDTLFGATFIVISPELAKKWLDVGWQASEKVKKYITASLGKSEEDRVTEGKEKTGADAGIVAINPGTKKEIPVWVADYVLGNVGTGAIMAVPAHDERDMAFAKKFNLPVSDAPLVSIEEGIKRSGGKRQVNYRLRDWLISRQRYWGPPIPIIYCDTCGPQGVPEKDLPVTLPYIEDFRPKGTGVSPLAADETFSKTKCPKCGGAGRRETDVSDTFLDSAWYYFRYIDPKNAKEPFDKERAKRWLPVDMYIGGAEHSVLHLLYTRFITKVFHDWGLIDFDEPFKKFRAHGLIIKDGAKMSKSKGNVVNPDTTIKEFGADALRMYLMFLGPFDQGGDFRDQGILGIERFLKRTWALFQNKNGVLKSKASEIEKTLHRSIKKVTEDIEHLKYNTAISQLMILLNEFEKSPGQLSPVSCQLFLTLLAPFAPHMTEEIWRNVLGNNTSIHREPWPEYDPALVQENTFRLVVQINGKTRDSIETAKDVSQGEAEKLARASEKVSRHLEKKTVRKVIFIKDRLINFVID